MSPTKAGQQIFHTRLSKTALKSIFYYSTEKFQKKKYKKPFETILN